MSPFRPGWPRTRTLAIALAMAACGTTATATVAVAAPSPSPKSLARAAEDYWTAERMAAAKPVEAGPTAKPAGKPASGLVQSPRSRIAAPAGTPQGVYGDGIPMVGTFFSSAGPAGATYCTASVVQSAGRNLVLTAGHCAKSMADGGQRIFVPQYRKGKDAANQPYGVFPVDKVFVDPRYTKNSTGPDSNLDFAFARVGVNAQGAKVEDRTGGLRLTSTPRWTSTVNVLGYPGSHNPDQRAIGCTVPTTRLPGYRQMQMKCGGYYGGVSGSPWITNYDAKSGTGDVVGNVGGWYGGGDAANDDWVSYSPVYDHEIQDLYQDAVADRTPVRAAAYQQPSDAGRLPGAASTWSHASYTVPGDFTGDGREDLMTVWSDGEVSLYAGDGAGGFSGEKQLAKPKSYWTRARAVTSGDFSGSGLPDVLVRWDTGKVSYYEDVTAAGFAKEYTLASAGSAWKGAVQITAGRFNSAQKANDLIVRWADGKVTLESGVSASGLGTERKLADSGSFWRNSASLTALQPSGQDRSNVVVRWSDGSLGSFALSGSGLSGTRLQAPNASWTQTVMTAGDFSSSGRRDDLVVRWSNGETSLYDGTAQGALGTWTPLVQP
ncbi:V8-like Glu-specific endopeptidase [Streptomyces olivoverticillatus]|uniref:V8-like Glu-specific endopeptidase n=1 Tax=Streptomyces olivoverticillatus TaxID=66427 RepID=A0A7W7LTZ4_9ACTN|nr:FG-GAP-like repeat-containing protein [Streptomyces olivoverticillatus]MBB4895711.1 V8-like Glu-specific endopeptidase [Streptomyces olivoverticillatus]